MQHDDDMQRHQTWSLKGWFSGFYRDLKHELGYTVFCSKPLLLGMGFHYPLYWWCWESIAVIYTYSDWWFGTWVLFSHILGRSSSQLTHSYFSDGWLYHQPDTYYHNRTRRCGTRQEDATGSISSWYHRRCLLISAENHFKNLRSKRISVWSGQVELCKHRGNRWLPLAKGISLYPHIFSFNSVLKDGKTRWCSFGFYLFITLVSTKTINPSPLVVHLTFKRNLRLCESGAGQDSESSD